MKITITRHLSGIYTGTCNDKEYPENGIYLDKSMLLLDILADNGIEVIHKNTIFDYREKPAKEVVFTVSNINPTIREEK